ncbi:sulfatase-like hydrolase/transferase [Acidobacteria bacterium AH-259-L09]|nr:sulfatase-like hydrolase/transferase [Acidobacteria bacterium AH-259-L09]
MRKSKAIFLICLAVVFTLVPFQAALAQSKPDRPNVLFLFSDDQRTDTIAAYGNRHIRTPSLDRLVQQGVSFRRAYCMGSMRGAVCVPSRAMLHSGRTLFRVPMDLQGVKILPEVLRQAGYTTFGTGKWHNKEESFARGFSHGKSVFFGGMSNHLKVPLQDLKSDGTYTQKAPGSKFSSELFADAVINFLKNYQENRPFFAYVAFSAPHDPRMPPKKYAVMYEPSKPPLPINFLPQHPFFNGHMTGRDESLAAWPRTPKIIRGQTAEYYGMITHMDYQIGRIIKALKQTGQAKNTLIIFASDHGLAMGSHGLLGKQNLYEHSMHAPLIFVGPGIPEDQSSHALTYLFDIFPTICQLTGIQIPDGVEGQSLVPIWQGKKKSVRDSIFTAFSTVMRAVRNDRWKLIRYPHINKSQLFDLHNDPHELKNLADDPDQEDRVRKMMALLQRWQKRVDDQQELTSANPQPAAIDLTAKERKPDRHQPEWIIRKYF